MIERTRFSVCNAETRFHLNGVFWLESGWIDLRSRCADTCAVKLLESGFRTRRPATVCTRPRAATQHGVAIDAMGSKVAVRLEECLLQHICSSCLRSQLLSPLPWRRRLRLGLQPRHAASHTPFRIDTRSHHDMTRSALSHE